MPIKNNFNIYSTKSKELIYLIDGNAYLYRAYYAVKYLSNSEGELTNATYGFVRMLLSLMKKCSPKHLAVFFDSRKITFRHYWYNKYKKNRSSMPEDLFKQIIWIKKIILNLGISIFEKPGYEADDLIGTVVHQMEPLGFKVIILTRDKDFIQLISPNCILWNFIGDKILEFDLIKFDFGIYPEQIIEVMGLSGDKADNIPGVPGIGIKTGLKLIKKYGNLDNCYKNIKNFYGKKLITNLLKFKRQAFLSRNLAKINKYCPLKFNVEDFFISEPNNEILYFIFNRLEFKALKKEFSILSGHYKKM